MTAELKVYLHINRNRNTGKRKQNLGEIVNTCAKYWAAIDEQEEANCYMLAFNDDYFWN